MLQAEITMLLRMHTAHNFTSRCADQADQNGVLCDAFEFCGLCNFSYLVRLRWHNTLRKSAIVPKLASDI